MATTISTKLAYNPGSMCIGTTFLFFSELSLPSTNVNFPSVTFCFKEGYDISETATYHSPFKCICSGRMFVKEPKLLFGQQLKEALETNLIVKESMTTYR